MRKATKLFAWFERFRSDYEWRTIMFAIGSCAVTIGFAAYNGVLAGLSGSVWFASLAVYYALLVAARGGILGSHRRGRKLGEDAHLLKRRDARSLLGCGVFLVALTLAFAGILVLTVAQGYHRVYWGHTIYVAAIYAFWKVSFGIYNFVKAQRRDDLTVQSLRNITIADALVSLVALQAAMLQAFTTEGDEILPDLFNSVTGGIVAVLLFALGVVMIIRGARRCHVLGKTAVAPETENKTKEGNEE